MNEHMKVLFGANTQPLQEEDLISSDKSKTSEETAVEADI